MAWYSTPHIERVIHSLPIFCTKTENFSCFVTELGIFYFYFVNIL